MGKSKSTVKKNNKIKAGKLPTLKRAADTWNSKPDKNKVVKKIPKVTDDKYAIVERFAKGKRNTSDSLTPLVLAPSVLDKFEPVSDTSTFVEKFDAKHLGGVERTTQSTSIDSTMREKKATPKLIAVNRFEGLIFDSDDDDEDEDNHGVKLQPSVLDSMLV